MSSCRSEPPRPSSPAAVPPAGTPSTESPDPADLRARLAAAEAALSVTQRDLTTAHDAIAARDAAAAAAATGGTDDALGDRGAPASARGGSGSAAGRPAAAAPSPPPRGPSALMAPPSGAPKLDRMATTTRVPTATPSAAGCPPPAPAPAAPAAPAALRLASLAPTTTGLTSRRGSPSLTGFRTLTSPARSCARTGCLCPLRHVTPSTLPPSPSAAGTRLRRGTGTALSRGRSSSKTTCSTPTSPLARPRST